VFAAKRSRILEREDALAFWLLFPTLVLLTLFIAYPFVRGVWLSLTDATVGEAGHFIGLRNFQRIFDDSIFRTAALNTFVYTGVTTVFKLALGLWLALLLNRHFRGKSWVRAFILLPFIIPTVLSTLAWKWMFDPDLQRLQLAVLEALDHQLAHQLARATRAWRWPRSRSSTSGAACRSTPSACWRACRPSTRTCTRRPRSTAPTAGSASGTSPGRCSCR
jgi:ABC-type sugar transport system permease subunit